MKFDDYCLIINDDYGEVIRKIKSKNKNRSYILINGARHQICLKGIKENLATVYLIFSVKHSILNRCYIRGLFEEKLLDTKIPLYVYNRLMIDYSYDTTNSFRKRLLENNEDDDKDIDDSDSDYDYDIKIEYRQPKLRKMIYDLIFFDYCAQLTDNIWIINLKNNCNSHD